MQSKLFASISAGLLLAGCANQEAFVTQNMRYVDYERDRAFCETKATQEIPVNRSPGAEVVVALLTGVYAVNDANAPARIRNYESCMLSKGYQRVELPVCSNINEARKNGVGPLNATERVQINGRTCVVGDNYGRVVFYTPDIEGPQ